MNIPQVIENYNSSPEKQEQIILEYCDYFRKNEQIVREIELSLPLGSKIILISGIGGSTKTFLSSMFPIISNRYSVVHLDCFARKIKQDSSEYIPTSYIPDYFEFEECLDSLDNLVSGSEIRLPIYNHELRRNSKVSDLVMPNQNYVLEGIHSHNPRFIEYAIRNGFLPIKILLEVDYEYLKRFTRTGDITPNDKINKRKDAYLTNVYPYSQDAQIRLRVTLDHSLVMEER